MDISKRKKDESFSLGTSRMLVKLLLLMGTAALLVALLYRVLQ